MQRKFLTTTKLFLGPLRQASGQKWRCVLNCVQNKNDIQVSNGKTKELVHERKKPYQCKIWDGTFKAKSNLKKHITSAHLKYVLENISTKSKPC